MQAGCCVFVTLKQLLTDTLLHGQLGKVLCYVWWRLICVHLIAPVVRQTESARLWYGSYQHSMAQRVLPCGTPCMLPHGLPLVLLNPCYSPHIYAVPAAGCLLLLLPGVCWPCNYCGQLGASTVLHIHACTHACCGDATVLPVCGVCLVLSISLIHSVCRHSSAGRARGSAVLVSWLVVLRRMSEHAQGRRDLNQIGRDSSNCL
jgi:hypothetical protein